MAVWVASGRNDMLLLTTGGSHGQPHTVPLLYLREGVTLVVDCLLRRPGPASCLVPESGGEARGRGPDLEQSAFAAVARTADPDERAVWWPRVVDAYGDYAVYQTRTERVIPVVFLNRDIPNARAVNER